MSYELPDESMSDVEDLLKTRMAMILPWASADDASTRRVSEYGRLARALRDLLEQKPRETRVRVLDYPTDDGRLWQDLEVDADPDFWGGCVAWDGGSA